MPRPLCRPTVLLALLTGLTGLSAGCAALPATPPDPFPPRPAAIDIERVDPCTTLSPQLRSELQVGPGQAGTAPVGGVTTRACGWGSLHTPFDYSVQLVPQDAADALQTPGAVIGTVAGYGSVRITDRLDTYPLCEIVVDINDGQLMRVQVQTLERQRGAGAPYSVEEVCGQADGVAGQAVRNAVGQAS